MPWPHFFFSRETGNKEKLVATQEEKIPEVVIDTIEVATTQDTVSFVNEPVPHRTVVLKDGQTLRLLSLELFGAREFWVYIFEENRDVLGNPNKVSSGIELKVPDVNRYDIDSNNKQYIEKAKMLESRILNKF